jgi:acetyl-CoA C-acetyltransferase
MNEVVVVSAVRTPIGRIRGSLSAVRPDDLAAHAIAAAIQRADLDPKLVEEVYFGCANQAGEDNRNVARMAALLAGLPHETAGVTLNRLCASGLSSINQAARAICCGESEILVAGGVENMSRAPYSLPKNPTAFGPSGNVNAWDTSLGWRYPNPLMEKLFPLEAMGETAENIYELSLNGEIAGGEITREEQDRFALRSHTLAVQAINEGTFKDEIVPIDIPQRKADPVRVEVDEQPFMKYADGSYQVATDLERLSRLAPAFRSGGTVTAGNSSSLNDGAAALVLMSAKRASELGLKPLARWVASTAAGVNPRTMGLGPVSAIRRLLARTEQNVGDLAQFEINEAFAIQALAVIRELELPADRVNPNGGAIALGHPLGCSGARIATTLIHNLRRKHSPGELGIAALCVGVGQGEATLFESL